MSKKLILDWEKYIDTAVQAVSEGCVLLENNGVLPLQKGENVSVFGRMQLHYYKSGTGSGGMVNVSKVVGITDALLLCDCINVNKELLNIYRNWDDAHPFDEGEGWGCEPWSQEEMPISDDVVAVAANVSDVAIVIIARTAGEDKDAVDTPGSYRLSDTELDMLQKVRAGFDKMVVLLNTGGMIDLSFIDNYKPDAVMLVWQGGMIGGIGTVDVLTGKRSPSGHLTDTICYNISDQLSDKNFGNPDETIYCEDIYVGYRYFETFAKEAVRYPFGYGMSYTEFTFSASDFSADIEKETVNVTVNVCNVGNYKGKAVIQMYVESPQGVLGKPLRTLVAYAKTDELQAGETQSVQFIIPFNRFASYDDSGITGHKSCFLLEAGKYTLHVGENVRTTDEAGYFFLEDEIIIEQLSESLAPVKEFSRVKPVCIDGKYTITYEKVPTLIKSEEEKRLENIPDELEFNAFGNYKLEDVYRGRATLEEFVSQMTDDDLSCIIRGEGMGSSRVTPGTAAAFGSVSDSLTERLGIPAVCCADGPSGMRIDCGAKAFSLPNGTMLGCSFNDSLIEELYSYTGMEMIYNKVDCLLGPGMNIHRHLLNGRNFEYFSEDPYLTGSMAMAMLRGLKKYGANGTAKHFCGNNQEYRRHYSDSVISERALREIYLKGFEMLVRSKAADSIMTTYGSVNGLWTAGNYDLNTDILRNQWGYRGIVMTDWWAHINERGKGHDKTNFAAMVRSQNDLYMVCPDGSRNASGDNTLESLLIGKLFRSELQGCAINICRFVMTTEAFRRHIGEETEIEVINRPKEDCDVDTSGVEFVVLDGDAVFDLTGKESKTGCSYLLPFDIKTVGHYEITLVGSSLLSELAQIPCTLFYSGYPLLSFTFHGTNGEDDSIVRETVFRQRFAVMRLYVAGNGLKLKEIRFKFVKGLEDNEE